MPPQGRAAPQPCLSSSSDMDDVTEIHAGQPDATAPDQRMEDTSRKTAITPLIAPWYDVQYHREQNSWVLQTAPDRSRRVGNTWISTPGEIKRSVDLLLCSARARRRCPVDLQSINWRRLRAGCPRTGRWRIHPGNRSAHQFALRNARPPAQAIARPPVASGISGAVRAAPHAVDPPHPASQRPEW